MARSVEHLAAFAVILFFVPFKTNLSGIELYIADLIGIASLGVMGVATARGRLHHSTIQASSFIFLFVLYILLAGTLSDVPAKLVLIEMVQWLSVAAFLGVLHQAGLLASPRFLSLVALYALAGSLYTAAWHLAQPGLPDFKQLNNTKYFFGFTCAMLYLLRHHISYSRILFAVAFVLLVMSEERKALLGIVMMIACDHLFCQQTHHPRERTTRVAIMTFVLFGGLLTAFSIWYIVGLPAILDQFEFTQFDILFADQQAARWDSEAWRKLLLANGLSLFLEYPIFGVGPKMLPEHIAPYFQNEALAIYTHNFALDVAIEYGAVGLSILIGGFLLALMRLFRARMENPVAFLLGVYILSMVLFVAVNSTIMLMFLLPLFINVRSESFARRLSQKTSRYRAVSTNRESTPSSLPTSASIITDPIPPHEEK
ncbi:capsular biosynthesis protein CpsG [Enterovibrio norvegicus]|uniref:O-antigen ligase family protein n=1 Tax=Enterovibrio norvegicus TaxID=188144 RepID=UPI0002F9844B|nr:O-antigen ligase family protein [Enterovibrio norvegicus]MCC4799488.1 O-antigen ligase family protein [Enterovibrio norvegicus]OEE51828.1 capsular biosynthesis protein CpsG [Enterovibrio norvegicus]PMH64831.1 capsular biosynthesis protein CpsG [Enterovibrio norvegicus]PMI31560.1 capsular biosynthesis protein CpsG [Enterovibrio norvegicus]PMI36806.1 capsular biosynthesis protein CpsG [Enterovibrio norvegicus]